MYTLEQIFQSKLAPTSMKRKQVRKRRTSFTENVKGLQEIEQVCRKQNRSVKHVQGLQKIEHFYTRRNSSAKRIKV